MDIDRFRAVSRERWEGAAAGWEAAREDFQRDAAPISAWLVDAIAAQPGHTVLELAAGPGDTGLMAAELIVPGGRLISTDSAEAMVRVAQRRAEDLGLDNVDARPMEAEWIDLPAATVDGVLCRWGLMLLADPETALRECRRVLRPGGRLAFAVWDAPEANPWMMGHLLLRLGLVEPSPEDEPGPFALADPEQVAELLAAAGFVDDVTIEALDFAFTAPGPDAWFAQQRNCSPTLAARTAELSPAQHYELRDAIDAELAQFTQPDGSVRIPARTLVAAAGA